MTALDLLRDLIACPSVNPASAAGDEAWRGEGRLLDLLERLLHSWGARVRRQRVLPGRENLIATFPGLDGSRSLLLEAHADTVGVDEARLLRPRLAHGRLYGRGACDTKGPMAAMLFGIREVLDQDGRLPVRVHFVATCDEECGARGARHLVASGFRADAGVVAEPTGLSIVTAHKGAVRFRVVAKGRAAHSSTPERGVNAIRLMAGFVTAVETSLSQRLAACRHPLLGSPTVSVGTIRGGNQVNVVPECCEVEMDRRLVPGETAAMALKQLRQVLAQVHPAGSRGSFTIETTQEYPPLEAPRTGAMARRAAEACRRVLGRTRFDAVPYATNAGLFAGAGIPCVVLGPGSIHQAHTAEEYIGVVEFRAAIRVYAEIIRGMGRGDAVGSP
jgi:acetylornithine deacetylase